VVRKWFGKLLLNGIGLFLTSFILVSVTVIKFHEGGWITLFITGALVILMSLIKINYEATDRQIKEMDVIVDEVEASQPVKYIPVRGKKDLPFDPNDKTAVVLVKDFTGVGLKTLFNLFRSFGPVFTNFVFIQVGLIDAGAFKAHTEIDRVKKKVEYELSRYVDLMRRHGYHAEGIPLYGIDTVEEVDKIAGKILGRYPNAAFIGGQIIFPKYSIMSKLLHNQTLFLVQEKLHKENIPLFILPIELTPVI
jgi:hypothetical protein